ncbi:MAG: succinate dehydrogenase, cytochrome b556 subunit [Rhodospirillales bacterium]|nr:succinate dehydrogenase, cytochrome b556 subunit [Rhodospirillales bacterium]
MADVREALMSGRNSEGARVRRPLSPHLQVYRPQITSTLSILHRMAGVALAVGTLLFVWWLAAAADSDAAFSLAAGVMNSPIGWLLIAGWTLALWYHFCNGIRHLWWDAGRGFELKEAHASGKFVVGAAVVLTALTLIVGALAR